jgi:hypothetical protein
MSDNLEQAFYNYLHVAFEFLESASAGFDLISRIDTIAGLDTGIKRARLQDVLGELERGPGFDRLVECLPSATARPVSCPGMVDLRDPSDDLRNFLRRSGVYVQLLSKAVPKMEPLFSSLRASLQQSTVTITTLVPLVGISLGDGTLTFNTFDVRRYTEVQLEELLSTKINSLHYQQRVLDTPWLEQFHWIVVRTEESLRDTRYNPMYLPPDPLIHAQYCPALRRALGMLSLYTWRFSWTAAREGRDRWACPRLPFVLCVNDYPLWEPFPIDVGDADSRWMQGSDKMPSDYSEKVSHWFELDPKETASFAAFLREMEMAIQLVSPVKQWSFVLIALYAVRHGFFTDNSCEQIYWHMLTVEALLGDKQPNLTERLATRVSSIYFPPGPDRDKCKANFRRLYKARCDIIHGHSLGPARLTWVVNEARYTARDLTVWFLRFLVAVQESCLAGILNREVFTRKRILTALDAGNAVGLFQGEVPAGFTQFPHMPGWIEPYRLAHGL